MNKTAIKNFAIWARNKLIADVRYQAGLIGITEDGISNKLPQSVGMTEFYDIGTDTPYQITGDALKQRENLVRLLNNKTKESDYKTAYKYILEEVAYTWFNRLIAVRFMEVNDYLPGHIRVLSSESSGKLEPDIVSDPFSSNLVFNQQEVSLINEMKKNNDLDGLFKVLFVKTCNSLNSILPGLFEETADYTELLLNLSIIDQDGVVFRLIHDISEEDFDVDQGGQVEIIGWLYQYYNTEPKNDAFAKDVKTTKNEIPAVTQLFTPDWIVRYMVENSLGRLWIDGHPNNELKANWKYYLDEAEQEVEVHAHLVKIREEHANLTPEDIKIIDPCMGSGHILVYAFDVLMQIYESVGYSKRDAAVKILENNIYGLDIDDRAYQLAYFAVMMKARQYNRRILTDNVICHVYSIQESNGITAAVLQNMGVNLSEEERAKAKSQIMGLIEEFHDAKEYGSILNITTCNWNLLRRFAVTRNEIEKGQIALDMHGENEAAKRLKILIDIAEVMSQKYDITITNPPYMAPTPRQKEFVADYYPDSKTDLFAVFIEKCGNMLKSGGYQAMVTMQSWMFLLSLEALRGKILDHGLISLLRIGYNSFPEMNSQVAHACSFVLTNSCIHKYLATYYDLNTGKVTDNKDEVFISKRANNDCFYRKNDYFDNIPGRPIAFSLSPSIVATFSNKKMPYYADVITGMTTGDNAQFLRVWSEVNFNNILLAASKMQDVDLAVNYWFPYSKGGKRRNWYGNTDYIVNWSKKDKFNRSKTTLQHLYFKPALTWPFINTDKFSARYLPQGYLWDVAGSPCIFFEESNMYYALGFLCSVVARTILSVINPTINIQAVDIEKLPLIVDETSKGTVVNIVNNSISIAKEEWDSYELSWDYKNHPLLSGTTLGRLISDKYKEWEDECNERFNQLKTNEEELNRIFIDVYGLQGELSSAVDDKDITVRKADLKCDIKSLLSYAVGCMFGRYSLDVEGLAYAGGDWDDGKYQTFVPDKDNVIPITDEEYLEDDIVSRLVTWLKVVYGEDTLEENLDFIASALGNRGDSSRTIIRNYFLNDFFDDHCQTYSVTGSGKRPIYWLFDSGKQNGFKALIYLHRYNADTIGNLRVDYLHRIQRIYESEITRMQDTIDNSANNRDIAQATKRKEKLTKQLKECREYDEKIGHLALARIELDLDDGVKVNYKKLQTANDSLFYEVLANSKNIMVKEKKENH
ncbi:N-6 DNA methylase [Ruminococcaceae bacterium R-25]|nr:N-6 DNA methylase [Ruminococcaceae bacterium R-25]SUQ11022.1 Methyltransferase domain-containing protein [Oscillospiraceae bacterium]